MILWARDKTGQICFLILVYPRHVHLLKMSGKLGFLFLSFEVLFNNLVKRIFCSHEFKQYFCFSFFSSMIWPPFYNMALQAMRQRSRVFFSLKVCPWYDHLITRLLCRNLVWVISFFIHLWHLPYVTALLQVGSVGFLLQHLVLSTFAICRDNCSVVF